MVFVMAISLFGSVGAIPYEDGEQSYITPANDNAIRLVGQVVANRYTDLWGSIQINNQLNLPRTVTVDLNTSNPATNNFLLQHGFGSTGFTFREGDSNAGAYLGQNIIFYVVTAGANHTIISVYPDTPRMHSVTFDITDLVAFPTGTTNLSGGMQFQRYADRVPTTVRTTGDTAVIFNGRAFDGFLFGNAMTDMFRPGLGGEILGGRTNGTITALTLPGNNNNVNVLFINSPSVFVVDEVNVAARRITARNHPDRGVPRTLNLDTENFNVSYSITKDGVPIGIEDINPWDVLMIEACGNFVDDGLFNIRVITNTVEGMITGISGMRFSINGVFYELAHGVYPSTGHFELGVSGTFFIDESGRIAAARFNPPEFQYGYVFAVADRSQGFISSPAQLQIISENGNVVIFDLAHWVTLRNWVGNQHQTMRSDGTVPWGTGRWPYWPLPEVEGIYYLEGQLIRFNTNAQGAINAIELANPSGGAHENHFRVMNNGVAGDFTFDARRNMMTRTAGSNVMVNPDTVVFFIDFGAPNASRVGRVYDLDDGAELREVLFFDPNNANEPAVMVTLIDSSQVRIAWARLIGIMHVNVQLRTYIGNPGDKLGYVFVAGYDRNNRFLGLSERQEIRVGFNNNHTFLASQIHQNAVNFRAFVWECMELMKPLGNYREVVGLGGWPPPIPPGTPISQGVQYGFIFGVNDFLGAPIARPAQAQIMLESGNIVIGNFANEVTIRNWQGGADVVMRANGSVDPGQPSRWPYWPLPQHWGIEYLSGRLIRFNANAAGAIDAIEFANPSITVPENHFRVMNNGVEDDFEFDRRRMMMTRIRGNNIMVNDDTLMFMIERDWSGRPIPEGSHVRRVSQLPDSTWLDDVLFFDPNHLNQPAVMVVGEFYIPSLPTSFALFDSVARMRNADGEDIAAVTFWQNGQRTTLTTVPGEPTWAVLSGSWSGFVRGTAFRYSLNMNGDIDAIFSIFTASRANGTRDIANPEFEIGSLWQLDTSPFNSGFLTYNFTGFSGGSQIRMLIGPVNSVVGSSIRLGRVDNVYGLEWRNGVNIAVTNSNTNFYMMDFMRSGSYILSPSHLGQIETIDSRVADYGAIVRFGTGANLALEHVDAPALEVRDWVVVLEVDNLATDVVIVRNTVRGTIFAQVPPFFSN